MITLDQYWMGRDKTHAADLTDEIRNNANATVRLVNQALKMFEEETGLVCDECASGWRPLAINDATANAAKNSKHVQALAMDVREVAGRALARWCLRNLNALEKIGLWMEDPRWTPTWVHLQIVPPGSGRRVYIPSIKPPLAAPLPEQSS